MQGRLTLHVRILVHISQVSGVFLKSQCQCSCTDILTKILTPCRYGKCFQRCWRYISLCGFNNNQFIDSPKNRCQKASVFLCLFFSVGSEGVFLECYAVSAYAFCNALGAHRYRRAYLLRRLLSPLCYGNGLPRGTVSSYPLRHCVSLR